MTKKILVMGLNDSGKTTFAKKLAYALNCPHLNNDEIRKQAKDWDFSSEGRKRQCLRMKEMAEALDGFVICDFICPTEDLRQLFEPDLLIWMNTTKHSKFKDTHKMFEDPKWFHFQIRSKQNNLYDLAIKQIKSLITADFSTLLKKDGSR
jgi:adenylylsulfate kinase|tara:strand:+ start:4883 stop:5332 length:450 start_codon:yes stop_codon:yes gene_type:complete